MVARVQRALTVVLAFAGLFVTMAAAWNVMNPASDAPRTEFFDEMTISTMGTGNSGDDYYVYVQNDAGTTNYGVSTPLKTVDGAGNWSVTISPTGGLPWSAGDRRIALKTVPGYDVRCTRLIKIIDI
jgi:hypothetical protein